MLTSCGRSVDVYSRKGTNWKSYKSFTVAPGELVAVLQKPINNARLLSDITESISGELASRGLARKDSADLRVAFTAEVVESLNVENVGPLGKAPADQPMEMGQSQTWTQAVRNGTLAMEIIDTKSGETVWRSSTAIEFTDDDFAVMFNAAAGRSLRKFPLK